MLIHFTESVFYRALDPNLELILDPFLQQMRKRLKLFFLSFMDEDVLYDSKSPLRNTSAIQNFSSKGAYPDLR